jgi:phosphopantothenoylcysteine decarboxylase
VANVLLGVTGSVAAIYTPQLFDELRQAGHAVKIVATKPALYFFRPADGALAPTPAGHRNPDVVILDEDEWPGERYQRGDTVLHIELRRWADVLLIAPLDANTLAKLALGLTDNCLTCVYRAWDPSRPIVLAPAMNTLMWEHPATRRHLAQIATDLRSGAGTPPGDLLDLVQWINELPIPLRIVPPVSKKLACDDVGVGAMASRPDILRFLHLVVDAI